MDSNKKRKEFWGIVKKVFVWIFVLTIILTFVVGLVYSPWGNNQTANAVKIAQINNKPYFYQPGSVYSYILNTAKNSLSRQAQGQADPSYLHAYAVRYSAQQLVNNAVLRDFSKSQGIEPSAEMVKYLIQVIMGGALTRVPDQGLVEYAKMEYANSALAGETGDLFSLVALTPTEGELFAFYDLKKFIAEGEILYLGVTNFILNQITEAELDAFYQTNLSNYVTEVVVENLAVYTNKMQAFEMNISALSNGWDAMKSANATKMGGLKTITLKNVPGMSKRFAAAIAVKPGNVTAKPQYEEGAYHLVHVLSFPSRQALTPEMQNQLRADFALKNFDSIETRAMPLIKDALAKARAAISAGQPLEAAARASGMQYSRIAPVDSVASSWSDEKKNEIPLILDPLWVGFLFSADPGSVSGDLNSGGYSVILKVNRREINNKLNYQYYDQQVAQEYVRFKALSIRKDWTEWLKAKYPYKMEDKNIDKLAAQEIF